MTPEIEGWLRLAEESREAAETLLGAGHARICASRAYYAMFYCASALHLSQGRSFSRHGSVIGAFARYFVKTGLFDRKFHSYLHGAFEERQISDYDALIHNIDRPGSIREIGTMLGNHNINIGRMQVGQEEEGNRNLIFLDTDIPIPPSVFEKIQNLPTVKSVTLLDL